MLRVLHCQCRSRYGDREVKQQRRLESPGCSRDMPALPLLARCCGCLAEAAGLLLLLGEPDSQATLLVPSGRSPSGQLGLLASLAASVSADTPGPAAQAAP